MVKSMPLSAYLSFYTTHMSESIPLPVKYTNVLSHLTYMVESNLLYVENTAL